MKPKFYTLTLLLSVFFFNTISGQTLDPFEPYVNDAGQFITTKLSDDIVAEEFKSMACPSSNDIQTPLNQNNGQRGIMFDIVALSNITINCFETNLASGTTPISIYYKVGTHVGFQNNAAAWTLIGTAPSVGSLGNNVNTPIPINVNISVTAQCTIAFYITRTNASGPTIQYTNGTAVGAVISADANMRVLDGTGKDFPFGASFQPRRFNGRVFYTTNAAGPGPGVVNGPTAVCAGSTNTYSLSTTGWTSYNWTVPAGTTITAGQNTNSITVTSGSTSGNICVIPVGICGPAPQVCLPVSQAPNPSSTISRNNVLCFGASTGSATISPTPAGTYTYQWSPSGGNGQTATGLAAGVYTVTATNSGNCRTIQTVTITQPPSGINANLVPSNVLCNSQVNGSVALSASGGTLPLTYLWSNGSTSQNLTSIASGVYNVTITDANGCTSTRSSTVTQPSVLNTSVIPTNILCYGNSTGSVDLTPQGGTLGYTYNWSNGSTNQDLTSLGAGTYSVTVRDLNNCTSTNSVTLTQPTALQTSTLQVIPQTCQSNGSVSVSVSGGTSTYNYNWSNGRTTQNISGLSAGSYNLTITDSNGCSITNGPNNIINIAPPTVTLASTNNVTCNGLSNGSLSVSTNGGTPRYNYQWSNGATTQNISAIPAGSYSVTVTDSLGCVLNLNALNVTQPLVLSLNSVPTNILCNSASTGSVNITTSGGTSAYSYLWNNGATTEDLNSLSIGSYTVTVTDANNCTTTNSVTLTQPPLLQTSTVQVIPQTCTNNGSVSVSVNGGTSTYNYSWSNGGTTQNISGLQPGNYSLTITDSNGCSITNGPNNIINIAPPTVTLASTNNVSCNSLSNGSLSISTIGGTPQYNYQWSNGATTQNISAIPAGSYSVTVTDSLGCVLNLNALNVSQPAVLASNANVTNLLCYNDNSGSMLTSTAGGTSPYNYLWNVGLTAQNLTSASAGIYTVSITDANGCLTVINDTITEPPLLQTSTLQVIPQTCTNNGSVSVSVSGGTSIYNYSWSNGGTTQNISGLQPGTYNLTITDSNGCSVSNGPNSIVNIAAPTVTLASTTNVSCNSFTDGSLNVNIVGGTPQYIYQWSNGASTQNISALSAGSYSLTVTDSLGCVLNLNALNVSQPAVLASNANVTNLLCYNDNSGSMLTSTAGGTTPYNYLWNVGLTAQNLTSASAGIYTVSITDANGCLTIINDTITEPPLLQTSTLQVIPQTCTNDGSVTVSVSGGTSIYNFNWSNGSTTQNISGLQPGTYNLTITDSNGCFVSNGPNSIVNIGAPTVTLASTTNVSCNSFTDGSLNVNIVGGTPQFIYQWSNGASTQNISALPAGSYSLTVTDSLGCVLNLSALNVSQPAILASSASVSDLLCFNDNSGSMLTSTAGGTTPYNYLWNVGLTAQNLTSASAGIYTVSITDANGCLTVINDTITEPPLLQTSTLQVIPQTCTNDGSVTVSVSGGTSTYNYSWSNGSTTQNISGLQPGSYNLIITDTNGCTVSNLNNQIAQIGSQSVTINSIANISCNGNSDGSIDLNVIGGTLPFIFNWNNGLTTEDINTLPAGNYDITVTDSLGCIVSINSISITEPAILSVNNTVNDLLCNGANSGSILSNVQGGTLPYNFIWSNGATTQNLTGISGAIYDLTITDANGCVVSQNAINVFEPTAVSINNLTIIDASCGVNDGTINITASGGTGSLSYLWSNGETFEDISNLPQGNYIVTVTDINNCSTSSSLLQLNGTPALAFSLTSTNELCAEPGTGTITLNNVSGTLPYNFLWSNGETTENLLNVNSGIYEVTVTDSDNCTFVTNTTITTPFVPLLNPGVWPTLAVDTSLGYGDVTSILGGVDQTAQGVTYNWTYSGIGTINFSDLNTIDTDIDSRNEGLYTLFLTATSLDGCLTVDSIQVYVEGFNPQIPTAFSPNGDGNNDIFRVVDIELESIIEFKIYNRWGQIIYDNPKIAEWDGTYNGIMQNRDAYIYIISWNRPDDGKVEKRRGSITLLR